MKCKKGKRGKNKPLITLNKVAFTNCSIRLEK
jgi:hypothetical protein